VFDLDEEALDEISVTVQKGAENRKVLAPRYRFYVGPASASGKLGALYISYIIGPSDGSSIAVWGMVEEIITALSHIRWLFVIARNSSFTYEGLAVDVKRVGRELGVRYVLEGSVRKGGGRVRITAQLIEAATGAHLWADRFDGSLEDVFDLQDKVASSVAGVIEPTLQAAETARSAGRSTDDLTADDLYLRGYAMVWSSAGAIMSARHDRAWL
jgi:TolB-like protein